MSTCKLIKLSYTYSVQTIKDINSRLTINDDTK